MSRAFRRLLLACLLAALSSSAYAGLFACNNTAKEISVAVGWKENDAWMAKGWTNIPSRDCKALLLGRLTGRYYYYYAVSSDGRNEWTSQRGAKFCTSRKAFRLVDSDACEGEIFRRLDVGNDEQHTFTFTEQGDPLAAATRCASLRSDGMDAFAKCWMKGVATSKQRQMLDCVDKTKSKASLAICAAGASGQVSGDTLRVATCAHNYSQQKRGDLFLSCIAKGNLNESQARAFDCAVKNETLADAASCAASGELNPEQRRIVGCVSRHRNNYVNAGLCAASGSLSPEQQRVAGCVLNSRGNYLQMGVCATGADLTPEQQVFANCAVTTGGQPYAFAGCVGTQLTLNELQKCMTEGIGGSGCFGENNTATKLVRNAWKDVTEGPGPSNDLLGQDGWVGRHMQNAVKDVTEGPGNTNDLVGKDGWVCQNLLGGC